MSGDRNPTGKPSIKPSMPEDIAAQAGLPRADDLGHSLHDIGKRVGREPETGLHAARDETAALSEARHSSETAARRASAAASGFGREAGDEAADAARSARERFRSSAADTRERASDAYDDVRSWASDRYDTQRRRAVDLADRGSQRLRDGRDAAGDFVSDNPLLVGVVGIAAGLLLGALLPRTRQESEALGPYADQLRDEGLRYARDVTRQGRAFVERALDPDNLDAAAQRASGDEGGRDGEHRSGQGGGQGGGQGNAQRSGYEGSERTAHRL